MRLNGVRLDWVDPVEWGKIEWDGMRWDEMG